MLLEKLLQGVKMSLNFPELLKRLQSKILQIKLHHQIELHLSKVQSLFKAVKMTLQVMLKNPQMMTILTNQHKVTVFEGQEAQYLHPTADFSIEFI